MSPQEAEWFGRILCRIAPAELSPLLNLGSSTLDYRTTACPHIEKSLMRPLIDRGVQILNMDLKDAPGVDIVGDILDPVVRARILSIGVKAILCNNLLEHVTDVPAMCNALAETCPAGGTLCLSVPHAFPFHPDPIDNGFRPSLSDLEGLFTPLGFRVDYGEVVTFGSYGQSILSNPILLVRDAYLMSLLPFNREKRQVLLGNYAFLLKTFKVSCVLLTKTK